MDYAKRPKIIHPKAKLIKGGLWVKRPSDEKPVLKKIRVWLWTK